MIEKSLTTRRKFMTTLGGLAATAIAAPYLRATDKSGCRAGVVGCGEHQYEVTHDWGALPDSIIYGNTHGVCQDAQGRIYIKHTVGKGSPCEDAIVVFDADGKFITSWGKEFKGGAHGMHINREGNEEFLYLCDPNRHLVVKTTLEGKEVLRLESPDGSGCYVKPSEFRPTNVAVAPDGRIYVADGYGRNYIHSYNSKGEYHSTFGGTGKAAGRLACPHGLIVDTRGAQPALLVADRGNRRLQYFTLDGQPAGFVTHELRAPCHFHIRGTDLLIPDLESRVTIFNRENKLVTHVGDGGHYNGIRDKGREAFTPGKFVAPHGACFDRDGNILVVEWVEVGRVTRLRRIS